jgi:hypothetical protein
MGSDLLGDKLAKKRLQTLTCSSARSNVCQCLPNVCLPSLEEKETVGNRQVRGISCKELFTHMLGRSPQEHHLNPSNVYIHVYHHTSLTRYINHSRFEVKSFVSRHVYKKTLPSSLNALRC